MNEEGNLYDPNKKSFDLGQAIEALGMTDEEQAGLRDRVALDLLLAHAGITEVQIELAFSQRIKAILAETAENLRSLADY